MTPDELAQEVKRLGTERDKLLAENAAMWKVLMSVLEMDRMEPGLRKVARFNEVVLDVFVTLAGIQESRTAANDSPEQARGPRAPQVREE